MWCPATPVQYQYLEAVLWRSESPFGVNLASCLLQVNSIFRSCLKRRVKKSILCTFQHGIDRSLDLSSSFFGSDSRSSYSASPRTSWKRSQQLSTALITSHCGGPAISILSDLGRNTRLPMHGLHMLCRPMKTSLNNYSHGRALFCTM